MFNARALLCTAILALVEGAAFAQPRIEYPTVAAAREGLLAKPGARAHDEGGWLVVNDADVTWTFAPASHEAHPAAVRRQLLEHEGRFYVHMEIKCEAAKGPCDRLFETFKDLNAQMMKAMEKAAKGAQ